MISILKHKNIREGGRERRKEERREGRREGKGKCLKNHFVMHTCQIFAKKTESVTVNLKNILTTLVSSYAS